MIWCYLLFFFDYLASFATYFCILSVWGGKLFGPKPWGIGKNEWWVIVFLQRIDAWTLSFSACVQIYISTYIQDTYLFDTLFIKMYIWCTFELHVDALGGVVCVWRDNSILGSWSSRGSHLLSKKACVSHLSQDACWASPPEPYCTSWTVDSIKMSEQFTWNRDMKFLGGHYAGQRAAWSQALGRLLDGKLQWHWPSTPSSELVMGRLSR